jgi:hypothetical protein
VYCCYCMLLDLYRKTEHHSQVVSTPTLYFGHPRFKVRPENWLAWGSHGLLQCIQANAMLLFYDHFLPHPLQFTVHYPLSDGFLNCEWKHGAWYLSNFLIPHVRYVIKWIYLLHYLSNKIQMMTGNMFYAHTYINYLYAGTWPSSGVYYIKLRSPYVKHT